MSSSATYPDDQNPVFDYLRVDTFITNIVEARALGTAFQLGIIDYIDKNQNSSFDNLKRQFGNNNKGLLLLLNLLKTSRVIEDSNGEISLTRQFLRALPYRDLLEAKLDFANFVAPDFTDHFTTLIKTPEHFGPDTRTFDLFAYNRCFDFTPENYELTKRWMRITTALTRYEAQACIEFHDFSRYQTMMDIGGNSGEFALQICKKYREISATIFDLPLVCHIGEEHVSSKPEAGRITFIKGNALTDVLPNGFDLISFKSMLHDWPDKEARHLIMKASQALKSGGEILIFERGEIEPDEKPLPYSMIPFLLFFNSFRSPLFYQEHLSELGFQKIEIQRIDLEMPFFLITATKA